MSHRCWLEKCDCGQDIIIVTITVIIINIITIIFFRVQFAHGEIGLLLNTLSIWLLWV